MLLRDGVIEPILYACDMTAKRVLYSCVRGLSRARYEAVGGYATTKWRVAERQPNLALGQGELWLAEDVVRAGSHS